MATPTTYKRQYRELSPETKSRISKSLSGTPKTEEHKARISNGLKSYWGKIPHRPKEHATIQDCLL